MKLKTFFLSFTALFCCSFLQAQTLPDYWFTDSYMSTKIKSVPKGSSFVFFTDTHIQRNNGGSAEFVAYLKNNTKASTVVFGGDCFDWAPTKEDAAVMLGGFSDSMEKALGKDFLWAQGNHDCNSNAVSKYKIAREIAIIPDTQAYDLTVKKLEGKVTFDDEIMPLLRTKGLPEEASAEAAAWGKMHYCYDDAKARIRFIILESGDNGNTIHTYKKLFKGWAAVQAPFVKKCLSDVPKGYAVVVAGHMFGSSKTGPNYALKPIIELLTEYNAKSKIKAMMISGHVHVDNAFSVRIENDKVAYTELGTNGKVPAGEVLLVWTSCDARASYAKYAKNTELQKCTAYPTIKKGTRTEHCADIVTFTKKKIVLTRFGVGEDRSYTL